jgi:AraC-like DNA-binding protein
MSSEFPVMDADIWHGTLDNSLETFGVLTGLMVNCPDVQTALDMQMVYRTIIGESEYLSYCCYDDNVVIQYSDEQALTPDTEESSESALKNFIRTVHLLRYYLNGDQLSVDVGFVGRALFDPSNYHDFFNGEVRFYCALNYMAFDVSVLKTENPHFNRLLFPLLTKQAQQEFERYRHQQNYAAQVKSKLLQLEQANQLVSVDLTQVSQALNISSWSLRRKLRAEATSFNQLLTEVRKKRAQHYLMDRTLVIGDISDRLGFSSQGAFSRFFLHQYGISPSAYRQRLSR